MCDEEKRNSISDKQLQEEGYERILSWRKRQKKKKSDAAKRKEEQRARDKENGFKDITIKAKTEVEGNLREIAKTINEGATFHEAIKQLLPEPNIREIVKEVPVEIERIVKKIVVKEVPKMLDPVLGEIKTILEKGEVKAWVIRAIVNL